MLIKRGKERTIVTEARTHTIANRERENKKRERERERERIVGVGSFFPALSFPKLINCKQA